MKINAIEMLSMNKMNNKIGMNRSASYMSDVPATESNTSSIAFQGGMLSKPISKAMIGVALALGALSLQSCKKDNVPAQGKEFNFYNYVSVDVSMWQGMIDEIRASREQDAKQHQELMEMLTLIYNSSEANRAVVYQWYQEYKAGQMDWDTFKANITDLLNSINDHVANIDKNVSDLAANFNAFRNDYNNHSANIEIKLDELAQNDSTKIAILTELNDMVLNMNIDIDGMKESSDSLYNLVANNHAELMDLLANKIGGSGSSISKADLEAMLNALGITISQAIEMSKDELLDAIKNFQDTYIATEENNVNVIGGKLDGLNAQFEKLFNEFVKFEANYEQYNKAFLEKFDISMDKLDDIIMAIEAFKAAQLTDNADILAAIKAMKGAQDITNAYLLLLNEKGDQVIDIIKDLDGSGNGGLTINQLKEYMGDEYFPTLEAMLKAFGLGDLNKEVTTIRELLEQMNGKLDGINVAIGKLDTIINQLNNLDFTDPEVRAKLDQIIDLLQNLKVECECKCNCGGTENHHEGTDQGGTGNLDDLFSKNDQINAALKEMLGDKYNTYYFLQPELARQMSIQA